MKNYLKPVQRFLFPTLRVLRESGLGFSKNNQGSRPRFNIAVRTRRTHLTPSRHKTSSWANRKAADRDFLKRKSYGPRYLQPPPLLGSAQACASAQVPDSPSLSWRICVKEPNLLPSVNSPHQSRREEQRAPARAGVRGEPPAPGAETPAPPAEAEPRPAGPRTHPTLSPASTPPPDTAGVHLV